MKYKELRAVKAMAVIRLDPSVGSHQSLMNNNNNQGH